MVDNINPIPQNPVPGEGPKEPQGGNPFYSGFGKPSDVHVNLSGSVPPQSSEPVVSPAVDPNTESKFSDFKAAQPAVNPNNHSYAAVSESLNWKGIGFIVGTGILLTIMFALGGYFVSGAVYKKTLEEAKADLVSTNRKLEEKKMPPAALELPKVTPRAETASPAPVAPTPTTTVPVETPAPAAPSADGGVQAQG
jgi:hypothetical protein